MNVRHEGLDVYRATIGSIGDVVRAEPAESAAREESIPMPIAIPTPWGEAELSECAATTAHLGPNKPSQPPRKEMRAAEGQRSAGEPS